MKNCIFFVFFISFLSGVSQKKYPTNYFRNPLDIPTVLSGTFGELRSNHFHAGIDMKTQRKKGLNVYAAADGYVSRIKVALWGYGKVIYINHPNGYTTVYAHLSKFGKGIEEYIKEYQYNKKSYETGSIYPKPGEIIVEKGQVIAYSGDTGGFVPPHLHFEIRNSKTANIINPMLFGINVQDTIAPRILKLMAYPINISSRINNSHRIQSLSFKKVKNNSYVTNRLVCSGKIGFGIHTWDRSGTALNKNGVYSIEMKLNGSRVYYHDLETFSFAESKYINLLIDYPHYAKYKNKIQKTHITNGNELSIYEGVVNGGFLTIEDNKNYSVDIIVKDFNGNTTKIKIPIKGKKSNTILTKKKDTLSVKIIAEQFKKIEKNGVSVAFPKNTFYEDTFLDFDVTGNVLKIHQPNIPLNKSFTITFDSTLYNQKDLDKLYIANINNPKYPNFQNTRKKKNKVFTTTKALGKYTLKLDAEKPKIYAPNFKNNQWLTKFKFLTIKISDTESGIKSYDAYIDGDWVLMEYNLKEKRLSYNLNDRKLVGSKHIFKLVVSDNVGNTNVYTSTFYRK